MTTRPKILADLGRLLIEAEIRRQKRQNKETSGLLAKVSPEVSKTGNHESNRRFDSTTTLGRLQNGA